MANTTPKQNFVASEPELKDLINLTKRDIFTNISCHHIGTVQSFNPLTQTATATINYKKTYFRFNAITGVYESYLVDYPLLIDCPVICLGGGEGSITFPIENGDECLILFNDRDFDTWFTSGNTGSGVATPRLHSFSDAIILVGVRSLANVLPSYNANGVEIAYGANTITLDATKFKASLASGVSIEIDAFGKLKINNAFGELISSLVNMIETAFTVTLLGNQPLVLNPVLQAIVDSFKV